MKSEVAELPKYVDIGGSKYGIHVKHLIELMLFYGTATIAVLAIILNLSFLMTEHHFSSGDSGLMISLFFLAIMTPGLFLDTIVKRCRKLTKAFSMLLITVGLFLIWIAPLEWLIISGCILCGFGYGIIQPLMYDKATHTALPEKETMALAYVMVMNYLAILVYPFIVTFLQDMFHTQSQELPFILNILIALGGFIWAYCRRNEFLFNDQLN